MTMCACECVKSLRVSSLRRCNDENMCGRYQTFIRFGINNRSFVCVSAHTHMHVCKFVRSFVLLVHLFLFLSSQCLYRLRRMCLCLACYVPISYQFIPCNNVHNPIDLVVFKPVRGKHTTGKWNRRERERERSCSTKRKQPQSQRQQFIHTTQIHVEKSFNAIVR